MKKLAQLIAFAAVATFGISQVSAEPMQFDYWPQQGIEAGSPRAQAQRGTASGGGRGLENRAGGDVRSEIDATVSGTRGRQSVNIGQRSAAQQGRTAVSKGQVMTATQIAAQAQAEQNAPRTRGVSSAGGRAQASRGQPASSAKPASSASPRSVVARSGTTARSAVVPGQRNVVARSGTTARASLSGSPMAASTTSNTSMARYGGGMMYGSVIQNLVDDQTGGLSQGAYDECLQNYYNCMDEICAARSPGQRRCACSSRTNMYIQLEDQMAGARETIIKLSSQLQMLETTRGGDISAAFQLTEAELSLNCVSYREAWVKSGQNNIGATTTTALVADKPASASNPKGYLRDWCLSHNFGNSHTFELDGNGLEACMDLGPKGPSYCTKLLGDRGAAALDGADSDIVMQLQAIANTVNSTDWLIGHDGDEWFGNLFANNSVYGANFGTVFDENCPEGTFSKIVDVDKTHTGYKTTTTSTTRTECVPMTDVLDLWGEALFDFAHNSVCKRILDNCFNGICGWTAEVSDVTKGLILPTNPGNNNIDKDCWDKQIRIGNPAVTRGGSVQNQTQTTYNKGNDQFFGLRAPITQARFSIKQKYHFDTNADCDVFGEDLKNQTRNLSLQMVAAEEMLKRKRLEFAEERLGNDAFELSAAQRNFIQCIDEINDCQMLNRCTTVGNESKPNTLMYIRGRCGTPSNVPSCYKQMVCGTSANKIVAKDTTKEVKTTTAGVPTTSISIDMNRNVVTFMEILDKAIYPNNIVSMGITGLDSDTVHPLETCMKAVLTEDTLNAIRNPVVNTCGS